jgi:menaquinone-dependent protoporphyrinogen oxidase
MLSVKVADILIIYSTTDGHTLEICHRLKQVIEQQSHAVQLVSLNEEPDVNIKNFDKVVVGASIRYGKHKPQVYEFIKTNRQILESKPNAFFSVNVVARKPEKCQPDTNPYMKKFLKKITWRPKKLAVFAGKIDYQRYSFWDRQIIRFIMWITKGPTDPYTIKDYTDWNQVEAFGRVISEM